MYIDEMKLTTKLDKGVYGMLKREMWRETVDYLENWGEEANREYAIDARRKQDIAERQKKVKAWEAKAKL